MSYQYVPSSAVVLDPNHEVLNRPTTNHVVRLSAEYVPIENLGIDVNVPFAAVRYDGTIPHSPPGKWDDGKFHYTPTDFRAGVRYQVLDEPYFALTPYIAGTIPMASYESIGFATGGRHLKQAHFGVSVGRTLSPALPSVFVMASYEYTLSEHFDANADTQKINENRNDLDAEVGYLMLDGDLVLNLAGNWRRPNGGVSFNDFNKLPPTLVNEHDPILKEQYLFVGGGLAYSITSAITVDVVVRFFVHGYNTRNQDLYGIDLNWRAF